MGTTCPQSVASIITGLSHNSSLTYLNISNSHFSMANVDRLTSILKDQSKCALTIFSLQNCHISSEGAVELAAGLRKNTTLQALNLSFNPIGANVVGVTAVAESLMENKALTKLCLVDCCINSEGAMKLAAALCNNSTLKILYMNNNPIDVNGASSMSDMLKHNKSLEVLHLCDGSLRKEGVSQLIKSLRCNKKLRTLRLPKEYKSNTSEDRIHWRWPIQNIALCKICSVFCVTFPHNLVMEYLISIISIPFYFVVCCHSCAVCGHFVVYNDLTKSHIDLQLWIIASFDAHGLEKYELCTLCWDLTIWSSLHVTTEKH